MTAPLLRLASLAVLAIAGARVGTAKEPDELFKWFDSLGYDAVRDGEFVRVDSTYGSGNGLVKVDPVYGFLISGGTKNFTILTTGLDRGRFPPAWATMSVYTPLSFAAWVKAELAPSKPGRFPDELFGGLSKSGRLFVLARACAARHLPIESAELLKRAETAATLSDSSKSEFAARLADDLGTHALWAAMAEFEDIRVTRKELLATLEKVIRDFPGSPSEDVAKETIETLRTMVAEEETKPPLSVPIEQLSVEEQVKELIFQLRDQSGYQRSSPGYPSVLDTEATSPANRLLALGFDAVPQLLDILQDHRYTRALAYSRIGWIGRPILFKDASREILEKISNRPFQVGEFRSIQDWDMKVERAARAWWNEVREKGEERTYIEQVERGDIQGSQQARYLAEKYPVAALSAIRLGLSRANESDARVSLIAAFMPLRQSKAAIELAKRSMTGGTSLRERLAGAKVLSASDPASAVRAMISEWKLMKHRDPDEASDDLVGFLAGSGRAEAVKALGFKLASEDVGLRRMVGQAFFYGSPPPSPRGYPEEGLQPQTEREKANYLMAIEDLLAGLLTDTSGAGGPTLNHGGNSFERPRMCDLAASTMAHLWPQQYTYRVTPSVSARDMMRYATLNIWRKKRGYGPVVPPKAALIRTGTAAQRTQLTRWLEGPGSGRRQALRQLMQESASSLLLVLEKISHENTTSAERDALEVLARTLACVVTSVKITGSGGELARIVKALKGKPLTSQWIKAFVSKSGATKGTGALRVEFLAERDEDGRGFTVIVKFATQGDELNPEHWNYWQSIYLNGKSLSNSGGSSMKWEGHLNYEFDYGLHEALSAPPNQTVTIEFSLSRPP